MTRAIRAEGAVSRNRGGRAAWSYSAVILTLGAAAIHFSVVPEHLAEYPPYGIFFVGVAIAQVAVAAAILMTPSRVLFIGAAAGTAAVILLWLVSRSVGLPIAPVPWRSEALGVPDAAATAMEGASCLIFLVLIRRPQGQAARGRVLTTVTTAPAIVLGALATFLGVGTALNPMPSAYNAAPQVPGRSSTSVADLIAPDGREAVKSFTLTASVARIGGHEAWVFNGAVPGPELRVSQGNRVRVTLVNDLPEGTSIHWHGIRVPNAEDGVAGITQDAVPPGRSYAYEFIADEPGTFWYHSHQDPNNQVPRGLFGAIVVEPRAATAPERDYVLMIHNLPGETTIAVNGRTPSLHLDANPGENVRLRLIDSVPGDNFGTPLTPALVGAPYTITSLDGHDLNQPQILGPERITLGMGQRADLLFKMPAAGAVRLDGLSGPEPFLPFLGHGSTATVLIGSGPAPPPLDVTQLPRFDPTSYGSRAADPIADAGRYDVTRQLLLGTGPGFHSGDFNILDTINGQTSPFVAPIRVHQGQLVRLHIVNSDRDRMWHPIHIHGHVFAILSKNGRALSGSPIHVDTVLVGPGETWDVAFRADNPGIWMLHCHVLVHALAGMSMTINYDGVFTPYTMGSRSGNIPE